MQTSQVLARKQNAITSNILNRIAVRGQRKVADALGINESQISRWKEVYPKDGHASGCAFGMGSLKTRISRAGF